MGNNNSQQDSEHLGYRVLGVQPNSPAAQSGLVSFFDFIVAANGVPLKSLDTTFIELIKVRLFPFVFLVHLIISKFLLFAGI